MWPIQEKQTSSIYSFFWCKKLKHKTNMYEKTIMEKIEGWEKILFDKRIWYLACWMLNPEMYFMYAKYQYLHHRLSFDLVFATKSPLVYKEYGLDYVTVFRWWKMHIYPPNLVLYLRIISNTFDSNSFWYFYTLLTFLWCKCFSTILNFFQIEFRMRFFCFLSLKLRSL